MAWRARQMKCNGFKVRDLENERSENTVSLEKGNVKREKGLETEDLEGGFKSIEVPKGTQFGKFNNTSNKQRGDKKSSGGEEKRQMK